MPPKTTLLNRVAYSITVCFLLVNFNFISDCDVGQGHDGLIEFRIRSKEQTKLKNALAEKAKREEENQELKTKLRNLEQELKTLGQTNKDETVSEGLSEHVTQPRTNQKQSTRPLILTNPYEGKTFSACLMWMDDMNLLVEWIAYNYQVLPLRHLVIYRDPQSALDPIPILDRWKPYMNITYWTENGDFMDASTVSRFNLRSPSKNTFFETQQSFYLGCLTHLHSLNRTWTVVYDVDEFLAPNSLVVPDAYGKMKQHGIAMEIVHKAHQRDPSVGFTIDTKPKWLTSCIGMKRKEYTSFESAKEDVLKDVPSSFDPYRFVTLRYRHPGLNDVKGKTIIDVSNYTWIDRHWRKVYQHQIIDECSKEATWGHSGDLMNVHHYLGSLERYLRSFDQRRHVYHNRNGVDRRAIFFEKNKKHKKIDMQRIDEARPWLSGLVDYLGPETASALLEGVGFPFNKSTALPILEPSMLVNGVRIGGMKMTP